MPWGHHDVLRSKATDLEARPGTCGPPSRTVEPGRTARADAAERIGLTWCQEPDRIVAEHTLRGVETPIGFSTYELTRALPTELESSAPTIEQIELELHDDGTGR